MMVIDTAHSRSTVGRIHASQARRMKIVRPLHSSKLQASEAKSSTSAAEKKERGGVGRNRSLVIRRRIMVPQMDEADDAPFYHCPPALSNQPKSSTIPASAGGTKKNLMDLSTDTARSHLDVIFARSTFAATTQDHPKFCKSSAAKAPTKTLHPFDLNELPALPDVDNIMSPVESPTSTIASADSTTVVTAASAEAAIPDVSFSSKSSPTGAVTKTFTVHGEDDPPKNTGPQLAVDLGVLAPASSLEPSIRHHNGEVYDSTTRPGITDIPTPARKRLRKLSEYGPGLHRRQAAHDKTVMANVCNHRDAAKSVVALSDREPIKARGKPAVDAEVVAAASVLMMLSTSTSSSWWRRKRSREVSSRAKAGTSSASTQGSRDPGPSSCSGQFSDDDDYGVDDLPDLQTSSGSSVLVRPSNKQRYRSMVDLMAQTPVLRRV